MACCNEMIKLHYHHHHYRSYKRLLQKTRTVGRPSARWHSMQHCWMTQRQRVSRRGCCLVVLHTRTPSLIPKPWVGVWELDYRTPCQVSISWERDCKNITICTPCTVVTNMSWTSSRFHLSSIEWSFFWAPWTVVGSEVNQSVSLH